MTAKPATKGTRTGDKARSGPSGPSTPRAQRKRRPVEITLGDEARALLDGEAARTGQSRSAVVEALVLRTLLELAPTPAPQLGFDLE